MTHLQAIIDYNRIVEICANDPTEASRLERGLATGALLALDSGDVERAKVIAKYALAAQELSFRRM